MNTSQPASRPLSAESCDPGACAAFDQLRELGIIGELHESLSFTDEPRFFQYWCESPLPDATEETEGRFGSALDLAKDFAQIRALGECVERLCLESIDESRLLYGTHVEFENAIDPASFLSFAPHQLHLPFADYVEQVRQSSFAWIQGQTLQGGAVCIPAQLIYVPYEAAVEPLIRSPISTGAAAGTSEADAISRGLLEVIERDAFMLAYLSGDPGHEVTGDASLGTLTPYFQRYKLEPRIFDISSDIPVTVAMAVLIDQQGGPSVSVGMKASLDSAAAYRGALLEAQHVRNWIRYLHLKSGGQVSRAEDIKNLSDRGFYWYPVERIELINSWLDNDGHSADSTFTAESLDAVLEYLADHNHSVLVVDIATTEVRDAGLHVKKVLVPSLHPMHLDEAAPFLGGKRLAERGIKVTQMPFPHPFM